MQEMRHIDIKMCKCKCLCDTLNVGGECVRGLAAL